MAKKNESIELNVGGMSTVGKNVKFSQEGPFLVFVIDSRRDVGKSGSEKNINLGTIGAPREVAELTEGPHEGADAKANITVYVPNPSYSETE